MSMPKYPDNDNMPTREEAINQIISSIAMEELGLSHIINAEGEKLQYALGTLEESSGPDAPLTMEELLKLNESIHNTLNSNMMNQFFLKEKLSKALSASVMEGPEGPMGPQGPQGPQGPEGRPGEGLKILGVYVNLEALRDDLGNGNMGDTAVADGILYISNGSDWIPVDNLGGPTGPAWEPDQPLFEVAGTAGGGETVGYEGKLDFTSSSLDISVSTGPTVNIEIPKPHSGAIIPFASGRSFTINLEGTGSRRGDGLAMGFGTGSVIDVPGDLDASITLPEAGGLSNDGHYVFPMPVDGRITAMTFYCTAYSPSGIVGRDSIVTARLYASDTPDNVFRPIAGATVELKIPGIFATSRQYRADINSAVDSQINAGDRLLFLVDYQNPGYNLASSVLGQFGGSIRIE